MKILTLPHSRLELPSRRAYGATSLRVWLADRWAILFSHPEDFAQEQLEMDRWISVLSRSFSARAVAPLALARAGYDPECGWLGRLAALDHEPAAVLALDPTPPETSTDLSAAALGASIARSGPRFAMIIDSDLRCRRTLSYRPPGEPPSPLDLIGWSVALRKRDHAAQSAREASQPALPTRSAWARNPGYAIAQACRG